VVHRTPQWTLEEYLKRFDRWEAVFIAKHGPTYVGYTYLTERECAAGTLNQCMTGVRPEYRRCGIGTALKARGIRYAQEQGFSTIVTRIRADNKASIAMNQKMGFRERRDPRTI
jgi:L-amino acid N-acyltransferase YncA